VLNERRIEIMAEEQSNVLVNGNGKVTEADAPPLNFAITTVVMGGGAQGVVFLLWAGKSLTISAEVKSSVKDGETAVVKATMDAGSSPETLIGEDVEVHVKENLIGFATTDRQGNLQYWTGQDESGAVKLLPVELGNLHVQDA
jgi:hypothetical protein